MEGGDFQKKVRDRGEPVIDFKSRGLQRLWVLISAVWILGSAYPLAIKPIQKSEQICTGREIIPILQDLTAKQLAQDGCLVKEVYKGEIHFGDSAYRAVPNGVSQDWVMKRVLMVVGTPAVIPFLIAVITGLTITIWDWIRDGFKEDAKGRAVEERAATEESKTKKADPWTE